MNNRNQSTALVMRRTRYVLERENISIKDFSEKTGITVRRLKTLFNSDRAELRMQEYLAIGEALELPLDYFTLIADEDLSPTNQQKNAEILYSVLRMTPEQRKDFFAFFEQEIKKTDS